MASIQQISTLSTPPISDSLSPQQAQVVADLAQGRTITSAATAAGVHRTTVYHWLRTLPEFKSAVAEASRLYKEALEDELIELSAAALQTLRTLLTDSQTHPGVRLKAALAVLERPRYPHQGWQLPADLASPREREVVEGLACLEADYKRAKIIDRVVKAEGRSTHPAERR